MKRYSITPIDILNNKIDNLQEDVVQIRAELKKIDIKIDKKLDKILDVVTLHQGTLNQRVKHLEHHTTHPPLVD